MAVILGTLDNAGLSIHEHHHRPDELVLELHVGKAEPYILIADDGLAEKLAWAAEGVERRLPEVTDV